MPEMWESEAVEAAEAREAEALAAEPPQTAPEESSALAVSVDDFAALEERVYRTVDLVKREREARKAAETRAAELQSRAMQVEARHAELESRATQAEARHAELEARAAQAEAQVLAHSPMVEQIQSELSGLRTEREHVRQRVEKLLQQLDALEL
ncbi:MAG: hypothetical protein ABSF23_02470 [Terracidiphilus sp.]|jgi:chromosome segregation ATPase